jgi:hypothetical protein
MNITSYICFGIKSGQATFLKIARPLLYARHPLFSSIIPHIKHRPPHGAADTGQVGAGNLGGGYVANRVTPKAIRSPAPRPGSPRSPALPVPVPAVPRANTYSPALTMLMALLPDIIGTKFS